MPRPRKNQSTADIDGTNKKRPSRAREVIPVDDSRPLKPVIIEKDKIASAIWDETVDILESMGLLCSQDVAILTAYCMNYRQLIKSVEYIQKNGDLDLTRHGSVAANGASANYQRYQTFHIKLMTQLGLTPAGRSALAKPIDPADKNDKSVGELLKRLGG